MSSSKTSIHFLYNLFKIVLSTSWSTFYYEHSIISGMTLLNSRNETCEGKEAKRTYEHITFISSYAGFDPTEVIHLFVMRTLNSSIEKRDKNICCKECISNMCDVSIIFALLVSRKFI